MASVHSRKYFLVTVVKTSAKATFKVLWSWLDLLLSRPADSFKNKTSEPVVKKCCQNGPKLTTPNPNETSYMNSYMQF